MKLVYKGLSLSISTLICLSLVIAPFHISADTYEPVNESDVVTYFPNYQANLKSWSLWVSTDRSAINSFYIDFLEPFILKSFDFQYSTLENNRAFSFTVSGSNDNSNYTAIGTYSMDLTTNLQNVSVNNDTKYRYYKWSYSTYNNTYAGGRYILAGFTPYGTYNPKYTLSLSVSPEGSGSVLNGGLYEDGTVVQIGAIPNNGYEFSSWSDGNTDNPRSITISSNLSLTANFVVSSGGGGGGDDPDPDPDPPVGDYYTVSGSAYPSGSGTVVGLGRYESGTVITVSASANQGYHFNSWSDGSTVNPRTYTVTSDLNIVANFDYDNSTVSSNPIIGINANVIGIDTYGDSITLPRINYIPNNTQGIIDGYLVSTNNNNSVYDLGNSPSVSGASSGLTVTFNVGGYLTSNSNININNLTKVLTEYEFVLDNYYRGTVVISDGNNQYTKYVNGNRFVFNTSSSELTTQSFSVVSYNLEQNSMANNIDILVNGTNSSNTSVSDLNSTDSDFNSSANNLIDYEDDFNTDMNNALQNIDTDFNFNNVFGSKFLASASWVKTQFDRITGSSPFGSVLSFSLLLGLALLLVGKVFK